MDNLAIVSWNPSEYRYELYIADKLKAYSDGHASTKDSHEEGKKYLILMAEENGYTVSQK